MAERTISSFIVEWLPYSTTKIVKIKDVRLGLAYLLAVFGVLMYCLFYVLLVQKQYLELADTDFSLRLNLQQPSEMEAMNPIRLPYCSQSGATMVFGRPTQECLILDQFDVVFPPPQGGAIFVSTRMSYSNLTLPPHCQLSTSLDCVFPPLLDNLTQTYFVAGIENFTLFVDHTMIASQFDISIPFYQMTGFLLGQGGGEVARYEPGPVNVTRNIFSIRQLLDAAGIGDLDQEQSVHYKNNTSMRNDGVVLLVTITYTNWVANSFALSAFNLNYFTYTYRVMHVSDTEFKAYETQYIQYPTQKIVNNRHGIRIVFLAEGKIGRFSFPVLLISLVSSFGLLSAAVIVLDFIATTILKERKIYTRHKYDDVEKPEETVMEDLRIPLQNSLE